MELEPRSSCGLEVIAYSSRMTITNMYPITVFHSKGNYTVNHTQVENMIWNGDRDSDDGCLYSECSNDFIVENEPSTFLFVNWDRNKNKTVTVQIFENKAIYLSVVSILLLT